jgi:hypothetical protein
VTAVAAAGAALAAGVAPAAAAARPAWFMTAGNVQRMSQEDPATTSHFFNTPGSYGAGASLVRTPVQAGYATTPVLSYTSYAHFNTDIQKGHISYAYKWVMYDPEAWSGTPAKEKTNPVRYLRLFGQLAHAHGLSVVEAPSLDLCAVPGTVLTRQPHESCAHWYVRVNIAGAAAAASDLYILQDESNATSLSQYDSMFSSASAQARAANPAVAVYSEVSTVDATLGQMTAAAQSISPDGFYVAAPGATSEALKFFRSMKASGD